MKRPLKAAGALFAPLLVLAATTGAVGAVPAAPSPAATPAIVAQVGHGHGGGGHGHGPGGGPHFHGGHGPGHFPGGPGFHHGPHFHHGPYGPWGGPRFGGFYAPYAYGFGAYPSYYFDDFDYADNYSECQALRRRAEATGSRRWWSRYRACIED